MGTCVVPRPPLAFLGAGGCFGEAEEEQYGAMRWAAGGVGSNLKGMSRRASDQVRRGGLGIVALPSWQRRAEQPHAKGEGGQATRWLPGRVREGFSGAQLKAVRVGEKKKA